MMHVPPLVLKFGLAGGSPWGGSGVPSDLRISYQAEERGLGWGIRHPKGVRY